MEFNTYRRDMVTKLTLSVDRNVARSIKRFAKARKTSVSAVFSQFARAVTRKEASEEKLSPIIRDITGIGKLPPDKNYRELLEEALMEKYGIKE
jgi:hypothetical protein